MIRKYCMLLLKVHVSPKDGATGAGAREKYEIETCRCEKNGGSKRVT